MTLGDVKTRRGWKNLRASTVDGGWTPPSRVVSRTESVEREETSGEPAVMTAAAFGSHFEVARKARDGSTPTVEVVRDRSSTEDPKVADSFRTTKGEGRIHQVLRR